MTLNNKIEYKQLNNKEYEKDDESCRDERYW